jgi:hypothetical protein
MSAGISTRLQTMPRKWLFFLTLIAGLLSFSGIISLGSQSQPASTEQLITSSASRGTIHIQSFFQIKKLQTFSFATHLYLLDFDRLETIRFHQAQKVFPSIKNRFLSSLLQHNVILGGDDIRYAITIG